MIKLILLLLLVSPFSIKAQEKSEQWIDLEWEAVQNSKGYDLELTEIIDQKKYPRGVFHSDTPNWSKEVPPGNYELRIRALDARKVPGQWGETIPVTVKFPAIQLLKPLQNENFVTNETDELNIHFQWNAVPGAKAYQFILTDSKYDIVLNETITTLEFNSKFNKIEDYKWTVLPLLSPENQIEKETIQSKKDIPFKNFSVRGEQLKSPWIEVQVVKDKGFIFRWKEIFRAQNYQYEIFKENADQELTSILKGDTKNKTQFVLPKKHVPEGRYIVSIKAVAKVFKESESSRILIQTDKNNLEVLNNESFKNFYSNRPLESSSIEFQFSYPTIDYSSSHFETDTLNEEKLRGMRLQGRWRKNISDSRYQNLLKFDYSEMANSNSAVSSYSISESIGKAILGPSVRFYYFGGIRLDNIPRLSANRLDNSESTDSFTVLGPEINLQFNYQWATNWSAEVRASLFMAFLGLSTPEGADLNPSASYDLEFKLLYSINEKFDFYTGINHSVHNLNSAATTGGTSLAMEGDVNKISFTSTCPIFGVEFYY
jgi:hypothetical protein